METTQNSAHSFTEGAEIPKEDKPVKPTCPTCGITKDGELSIFCSNSFHLPEPLNVKGAERQEAIFEGIKTMMFSAYSLGKDDDGTFFNWFERNDMQKIIKSHCEEYATVQRNEAIKSVETLMKASKRALMDDPKSNYLTNRISILQEVLDLIEDKPF